MTLLTGEQKQRDWMPFAAAIACGVLTFQLGFRLTSEVPPVLLLLVMASALFGFALKRRPWLWGLGLGLGARLLPEPALSQEHIRREGASRPLPLPFGLTENAVAQWAVGSLIITLFPLAGSFVGWVFGSSSGPPPGQD